MFDIKEKLVCVFLNNRYKVSICDIQLEEVNLKSQLILNSSK